LAPFLAQGAHTSPLLSLERRGAAQPTTRYGAPPPVDPYAAMLGLGGTGAYGPALGMGYADGGYPDP